ncbi:MAG: hypothetical protein DBO98_04005 [Candidatus Liberibacter europaeus]|nr:hypothetical protein [Candidatus Liberibacter europaeus]
MFSGCDTFASESSFKNSEITKDIRDPQNTKNNIKASILFPSYGVESEVSYILKLEEMGGGYCPMDRR